MTKYIMTVELDLSEDIPAKHELKPHDHPQIMWAKQRVASLIQDLVVHYMNRTMEYSLEEDETMRKAFLAANSQDYNLARQLEQFALVELEEEENESDSD